MSENGIENEENAGNSALDWEIFDVLCRDELKLDVSFFFSRKLKIFNQN